MNFPKNTNLFIAAFFGGTALTWLELMNIFFHHPEDLNIYFFGGMFVAGVIGLGVSRIIAGDTNIRSAFLTGVAAPQILGGIIKTGTVVSTNIAFSLLPLIYAGPPPVLEDSTKIEITVKGTNELVTIQDMNTDQEYIITPNQPIKIPYSDSLEIKSHNAEGKKINITKDYIVDNTKKLDVIIIPKYRTRGIFRGLFAQQYTAHESLTKKITVKEIKQEPKPEPEIIDSTDNE